MNIIRPGETVNYLNTRNSIFLAGPTPRDEKGIDWRPEAINLFDQQQFDGTLLVPSPFLSVYNSHSENYYFQIEWEDRALQAASVIMFWIPRDLKTMPAFTTNVEFGMYVASGKVIYGRPKINYQTPPKTSYLDHHAIKNNVPVLDSLQETVAAAIAMLYG